MHEYGMVGMGFVLGVVASFFGAFFAFRFQLKIETKKRNDEILRFVLNPISQRLHRLLEAIIFLEEQEIIEDQWIMDFVLDDWAEIESLFYQYIHLMDDDLRKGFEVLIKQTLVADVFWYAKEYANGVDTELDHDWPNWKTNTLEYIEELNNLINKKRDNLVELVQKIKGNLIKLHV